MTKQLMRYSFALLLVTPIFATISADSKGDKGCLTINGPARYSDEKLGGLTVHGPASLKRVQVDPGNITVHGPLKGKVIKAKSVNVQGPVSAVKLNAQTLEVNGLVKLKQCHIRGNVVINGSLKDVASTFDGNIDIAADTVTLVNSHAKTIYVRKNPDASKKQRVYLKDATVVKSIRFEKEGGEVIVSASAVLQDENVPGGQLIKTGL